MLYFKERNSEFVISETTNRARAPTFANYLLDVLMHSWSDCTLALILQVSETQNSEDIL